MYVSGDLVVNALVAGLLLGLPAVVWILILVGSLALTVASFVWNIPFLRWPSLALLLFSIGATASRYIVRGWA